MASLENDNTATTNSSLFKEYRDDLISYLANVRNEIKEVLQDDAYLLKMFADNDDTNEEEDKKNDDEDTGGNFVIEHSDTFRQGELALYIENMYNEFDLNHDEKLGKGEITMFLCKFLNISRGHSVNQIRAELDNDVRGAMTTWKKKQEEENPTFQGDLEKAFVKAKNTHYNDRNK